MSRRLQVLMGEDEHDELRAVARRNGMSVSEWVRQALRRARRDEPTADVERKLAVIRAAATHRFPAGDVGEMLAEIERGYLDE